MLNRILVGFSLLSVVACNQHFLLHLSFYPVVEPPTLPLRIRHEDASYRIQMGREILIYLDRYNSSWTGLVESAHGETSELTLLPRRAKAIEKITIMDTDLNIQYYISCEPYFYGPSCSERCIPNENGGHYSCNRRGEKQCLIGWFGQNCDQEISLCSRASPCQNKALCVALSNQDFKCACPSGFEGPLCERRIKETVTTTLPLTTTSVPTTTTPRSLPKTGASSGTKILIIGALVAVLATASLLAIFLRHLRKTSCRKKTLSFPSLPKCDVGPATIESPPRYVPSPRLGQVTFEVMPQLPASAVPTHYVSQEDLHV